VPGFLVRIGSPRSPASEPLWFQGETHPLAGEGVKGADSDEGTDTVVLWV
jgi:hypothetical protein